MTTTDDTAALMAAILEQPDEDMPRLVYADALDERGQPGDAARAEFIRLQCGLYRPPLWTRQQLFIRGEQLIGTHGRVWANAMGHTFHAVQTCDDATSDPDPTHATAVFRRGFIDEVRAPLSDVFEQSDSPCPGCSGTGIHPHSVGANCFDCSDTGLLGGVEWRPTARALAWLCEFPTITRVVLTDREPYHNTGAAWIWVPSVTDADLIQPSVIPGDVYRTIADDCGAHPEHFKPYRTREAAVDALATAAARVIHDALRVQAEAA